MALDPIEIARLNAQLGLAVIARNLGRAPAQVDGYSIEFGSRASFTQPGMAINPQLPHTLDPGAKATFFIPMEGVRAASMLGGKGKAVKYRATVSLGTGQVKYSAWDTKPLPDDGT